MKGHEGRLDHRASHTGDGFESRNEDEGEQKCGDSSSNVSFPGLLGREGNELPLAEEVAEYVGEDVVDDDKSTGDDVEKHAFEDGVDQIPTLVNCQEHCHHDPPEQPELILEVALFQTEHEPHEPPNHKTATNDVVVVEQKPNCRVPDAQDGELRQHEGTNSIVVDEQVDVPIDVFGHGDFYLLLFVPLQPVQLGEDHEVKHQNHQRSVELACGQEQHEP